MFGANKISNVVENAIKSNNVVNIDEAQNGKVSLASLLLGVLIVLVLNLLVGPWLWNNILKRLVPFVTKARWYDTVALGVLLGLILPN
tara:strand:+ start:495 stop:758 length:264 start_codon:yes stop_codon:yes gene_type:complete